ncbi:hydroxyversicolorone monooxygenase [Microdochium nivale]|nr:hydroxyversicolorone monooxygenase [Microdochium nivale]
MTVLLASEKGAYRVEEKPLGAAKHVRIVGIGAGASGINMVRTLRQNLTNFEHVIYEKNSKAGGTWFENRYPGCRCDVPSHNYQFSWRPNPSWSNFCSPAEEIERYLDDIVKSEHMTGLIHMSHQVVSAEWNEQRGVWALVVRDLQNGVEFEDEANFLVDASGILNKWKWPEISGLHSFAGDLIHTAAWPEKYDYTNKKVAVIGNGSSGVQLVPAIQPAVRKLCHFVRSPTWILPPLVMSLKAMKGPASKILEEIEMNEQGDFSPAQIERFKSDPELYRSFIKTIEKDASGNFPIVLNGSPVQHFATQKVTEFMTASLRGDDQLCKALIPSFPLGCRRMTPAPGYLQSLQQPNVELYTDSIARVVESGIELRSGELVEVDAIICATGFDTSFVPRFPILGRHGNVQDIMAADVPRGYMSCALPRVPNYFTFLGPNGPIGHGSVFTLSEHIAKYITSVIRKCQTEGIKALAPSQAATDDFSEHIASFMPRTSWSSPSCRSWFKGGGGGGGAERGSVTAMHPGSRVHFLHMLESFRGEDWEYTYDSPVGNRFAYLGNGFSTRELDPKADPTWYLNDTASKL